MRELRCPACGRANVVDAEASLDRVRCAACEGALDGEYEVRYFVAEGRHVRGPQVRRALAHSAALGTLRPDMLLSEEGGPWVLAAERADLFEGVRVPPPYRHVVAQRRLRTSIGGVRRIPGGVNTMAALDVIGAVFFLLLGIASLAVAGTMRGAGGVLGASLLFFLVSFVLFALRKQLRLGSLVARNVQLVLATLACILVLAWVVNGLPLGIALLGALAAALPFALLRSRDANAFFRGD